MSFLVPKKPQILYAPMLASFGGGSARGFNPGGGGGGGAFLEFALIAGGGGGGDGNAPGGGGGAGGFVSGSGTFPFSPQFRLQLGAGGQAPQGGDQSGAPGFQTRLYDHVSGGSGCDIRAYGGGRGGSYQTAADAANSTDQYGSGGGGAGPHYAHTSGGVHGLNGIVEQSSLIPDISTSFYGGNGADYQTSYKGGGGGGAGGNASADNGGPAKNPTGQTSSNSLWTSSLLWGRGGFGAPAGGQQGGGSVRGFGHLGNGGQGSGDVAGYDEQCGSIGGAIINFPPDVTVSITGSNGNMSTTNASVNGGTSYIFYDARYYLTNGSNSGYFDITIT
jgi:hypothetical protein